MRMTINVAVTAFVFAAGSASAGDTLPRQKAEELGVKKCFAKIEKIADYAIEKASHGSDATWNSKDVDGRLVSFFVSRGYSDGDSQINMQFAPTLSGGCDVVYTETMVFESQCSIVREDTFKKWKYRSSLNNKTLILQSESGNVDVYLTPTGKKSDICIVTRREVGY